MCGGELGREEVEARAVLQANKGHGGEGSREEGRRPEKDDGDNERKAEQRGQGCARGEGGG